MAERFYPHSLYLTPPSITARDPSKYGQYEGVGGRREYSVWCQLPCPWENWPVFLDCSPGVYLQGAFV